MKPRLVLCPDTSRVRHRQEDRETAIRSVIHDAIFFFRFMIQTLLLPNSEQMKNLHHKLDQENLKFALMIPSNCETSISGTSTGSAPELQDERRSALAASREARTWYSTGLTQKFLPAER
ncbi:unnamed protein product [Sphagnum jensenii]|uniref:Uncharacterized protein n=1 Tax=Sphagnum jensenii TaxID=128206 RepID=A0ABP1ALG1_9BRYO